MTSGNGSNGNGVRAFDPASFTDSNGDRWTVRASRVEPGWVDVLLDLGETEVDEPDAGNLGVSIHCDDIHQLTNRLVAAGMSAKRLASNPDPKTAALMSTPEAREANMAAVKAAAETCGTIREKAAAGMKAWHETYAATNKPVCDGTCGDQCDDAYSVSPAAQVVS